MQTVTRVEHFLLYPTTHTLFPVFQEKGHDLKCISSEVWLKKHERVLPAISVAEKGLSLQRPLSGCGNAALLSVSNWKTIIYSAY